MLERDAEIIRLYKTGMLLKHIAVAVGMASNSIGYILKKHGIERPKKPQKSWSGWEIDKDKVAGLWGEGLCASQIAERLSISRHTVSDILRKLNLTSASNPRHRYDGSAVGGPGRSGFAAAIARRT